MIKVSIIVPVYNTKSYLDKCLNSIINQTLKEIEIIVINDGSTDNSQAIINQYVKKDSRVKTYLKENGGLGDARNYGMQYATGEYIGFVDSDDFIDHSMYEGMYNLAIKDSSDLVECDVLWVYHNKLKLDQGHYYQDLEHLFLNIRVMVPNKIFKRDLIMSHQISFPIGLLYEDILFTYKALPYIKKVSHVDKTLYFYIQRNYSLSNHQTERVKDIFAIFDQLDQYYHDNNLYDEYKNKLEYLHIRYLLGSSFLRIVKIADKTVRKRILNDNWTYLNSKYPNWKRNPYLKEIKGFKNVYYRYTSKLTYQTVSIIFRLKK